MKRFLAALTFTASAVFAQEAQETFFHNAGVELELSGRDSLLMHFTAGAEDLMNTVGVFPLGENAKTLYPLYERKLEAYIQDKVPVSLDGRRLFFRVVRWKPGGKGRDDGFDSLSMNVNRQHITLATRLPRGEHKRLEVTANLWLEREDSGRTLVEYALLQDGVDLRRLWVFREKPVRFPLHPDSLAAMRKTPPPPPSKDEDFPGHEH